MRQRGFALITAVFLVMMLALLAAAIGTLSTTQQAGQMRDVLGSRAYFAARTGLEWGVYQVLRNGGACAASTSLPALAGSAAGFAVQVQCTRSGPYNEGGAVSSTYQLVSTARFGSFGAPNYVERQLQVLVTGP